MNLAPLLVMPRRQSLSEHQLLSWAQRPGWDFRLVLLVRLALMCGQVALEELDESRSLELGRGWGRRVESTLEGFLPFLNVLGDGVIALTSALAANAHVGVLEHKFLIDPCNGDTTADPRFDRFNLA
jgi:hypothetical protein